MPITLALPLDLPDVPVLASRLLEERRPVSRPSASNCRTAVVTPAGMAAPEPGPARPGGEPVPTVPDLASASRLSMTLTALFDGSPDRITAQPRLHRWGARVTVAGITCFAKVLTTLQHWQDGILKYFNSRHPSGFVDGLNNTLKLLTRRCVGLER